MRTKTAGAFAYVTDNEGKILCVRQNYDQKLWSLPGGSIEAGEDPRATVIREVYEETGLTVEVGDLIGTYWATYRDDIVLLFQAKTKEFNLGSPNQEIAELGFFPSPNLPEPFSPNMRIRLKDAIEGRRGVFRVFESLGVIRS